MRDTCDVGKAKPSPVTAPVLDAIVGAALKAMVEAGADAAAIGAFANRYRSDVATILGLPEVQQPNAAPDLSAIVAHALRQVLHPVPTQSDKPPPRRTRINVMIDGRRTSVSIPTAIVHEVQQARLGKPGRKLQAIVEELAAKAPRDTNRSAWIVEQLRHQAPPGLH